MRRIAEKISGAHMTHGALAPMRRIPQGVLGGERAFLDRRLNDH